MHRVRTQVAGGDGVSAPMTPSDRHHVGRLLAETKFWALDLECDDLREYSLPEYESAGGDLHALRSDAADAGDAGLCRLVDLYTAGDAA